MTISEDMVERAARAIVHECNERGEYDTPASEWAIADLKNHRIWEDACAALTAALGGSSVVPREPTTTMLAAGQKAWREDELKRSTTLWRAMWDAANTRHDGNTTTSAPANDGSAQ